MLFRYVLSFYLLINCLLTASPDVLIIGIAGGTGSGKTTLAKHIGEIFKEDILVISQDNFYKDLSHIPFEKRYNKNFDHPDSLDFNKLRQTLKALKKGEKAELPQYDFVSCTTAPNPITLSPKKIIVLEGILIFTQPEIRNLLDLKLFVQTESDLRLLRRIERDLKERGATLEQIKKQYFATVQPMHKKFVEPSKVHADIIIPEGGDNQHALHLISLFLKEHLEDKRSS